MTTDGVSSRFPPVVLNTTLADFLKAEDPSGSLETFCCIKPNSDKQYGTAVPLSDKYIIHSAQVDTGDDLAHLQLEICSYLLMFFAGKMNVMMVACEGETKRYTKKVLTEMLSIASVSSRRVNVPLSSRHHNPSAR